MNPSIYNVNLDIHKSTVQICLVMKQGDTGRRICFYLVRKRCGICDISKLRCGFARQKAGRQLFVQLMQY